LIATIAAASILTEATLLFVEPTRKFSLFGLYWGLFARVLQWSVLRGIKTNIKKNRNSRILGEQLFALPVAKRLVSIELALSLVFLFLGIG
jgi:hypothetical protein